MLNSVIKYLVFLVLVTLFFPGYSQSVSNDSLKIILEQAEDDAQKLKFILELARKDNFYDREKAIHYYTRALDYENDKFKRGLILDTIGLFNWQLGQFEKAIENYEKAKLLFEETDSKIWLGKVYNNIAVAYSGMGETYKALEFYQTALKLRRSINDKRGVSTVLNNIGRIYQQWQAFDQAYNYHKEALEIVLNTDEYSAIAYSYSNLALYYENKQEYEKALEFYRKGYETDLKKKKTNRSVSFFLANIGRVFSKKNELDSALVYYKGSLQNAIEINNKNRIAIAQFFIGETFLKNNNLDSAEHYINKSFALSEENKYVDFLKNNLFLLSEIAEKRGNTTDALAYFKEASALKDSIFNKVKMAEFTERIETENTLLREKNEAQEAIIAQQKKINWLILGSSILILIVLLFTLRIAWTLKKLSKKLEKSERELQIANANKDKFFTIIAHDLKSPFNGLLGMTEILDTNFSEINEEKRKRVIQSIRHSTLQLYNLLEGLLNWAQIQTGKMIFQFEKINLYVLATKVTELFTTNAKKKNITVINEIPVETYVHADDKSVSTILRNLISNGIKFTNSGGQILISAELKNGEVQISVSDNGVGIPKLALKCLFDITEKTSSPGTESEKGTGLGLILCKELVEKNNGTIWAESEEGKGSTISFTLPAEKPGKYAKPQKPEKKVLHQTV